MNRYTIHQDNYEAIAKLARNLGTLVPRTLSPALEYTILASDPLLGPSLVRLARASSLTKIDVHSYFKALTKNVTVHS